MVSLNTSVKRTAGPRLSLLTNAAAARPAVILPMYIRTFASENKSKKDDVPRTATGEIQKQNNFASEVGKKMQELAPGGEPRGSASSGKGNSSRQEHSKSGSK